MPHLPLYKEIEKRKEGRNGHKKSLIRDSDQAKENITINRKV
jgi:hypothetical protein